MQLSYDENQKFESRKVVFDMVHQNWRCMRQNINFEQLSLFIHSHKHKLSNNLRNNLQLDVEQKTESSLRRRKCSMLPRRSMLHRFTVLHLPKFLNAWKSMFGGRHDVSNNKCPLLCILKTMNSIYIKKYIIFSNLIYKMFVLFLYYIKGNVSKNIFLT